MSVYGLKLLLLATFSIACFVAVNRKLFFVGFGKKAVIFWLSMLPFIFLLNNQLLTLLGAFALLMVLSRNQSPAITVAFFIVTVSAVPDWVDYRMSAPGINYLLKLSHDKVAVLALLAPLLLFVYKKAKVPWNTTDSLVVAFVLLTTLLTFRNGQLTFVMRFLASSIIIYIIPYFVISRTIRSVKDMHYCALAFLMLAILLSAVLLMSQALQTDMYDTFNPRSRSNILREYRGGFLRLSGPSIGVMLSFLMLCGLLALDVLKKYRLVPLVVFWPLVASFGLCVLFTGSRGGLLSFVIGVGIYAYFIKLAGTGRVVCSVILLLLVILEYGFGLTSFLVYQDEYGTFDYRSELYQTSWIYLQQHFLFGSPSYLESGQFNHLITGLGIIDIVSAYLQVALKYGFVGLLLFISIYLSVLVPLCKRLFSAITNSDFEDERVVYTVMYFTLNLVMVFLLTTTSMLSYFPIFMMINIAIGRSLLVAR
jgi:hypothetical protein